MCKIHKALDGLKQDLRAWFHNSKGALEQQGFKSFVSDNSFFYYRNNGKLLCMLVYVDHILITREDSRLIAKLIGNMNKKFALTTLGLVNYFCTSAFQ